MSAAELASMVDAALASPAEVPPRAVSITQGTEASTVYTPRGGARHDRPRVRPRAAAPGWHLDGARLGQRRGPARLTPAEVNAGSRAFDTPVVRRHQNGASPPRTPSCFQP